MDCRDVFLTSDVSSQFIQGPRDGKFRSSRVHVTQISRKRYIYCRVNWSASISFSICSFLRTSYPKYETFVIFYTPKLFTSIVRGSFVTQTLNSIRTRFPWFKQIFFVPSRFVLTVLRFLHHRTLGISSPKDDTRQNSSHCKNNRIEQIQCTGRIIEATITQKIISSN